MSELGDYPPAPLPPPENVTRRDLLKWFAATATGMALFSPKGERLAEDVLWGNTPQKIGPAHGSESIRTGDPEWLVLPGFGQSDTRNAADELFVSLNRQQAVHWVQYSSKGIALPSLGSMISTYLDNRNIRELNVVGVSMGLPIDFSVMPYIKLSRSVHLGIKAGYSSPYDITDAFHGSTIKRVITISQKLKHQPGLLDKLLYSAVDGPGDWQKSLNIFDTDQWFAQGLQTLTQTFNPASPLLAYSQAEILCNFNAVRALKGLPECFDSSRLQIVYCQATTDRIVNERQASEKYRNKLGRPFTLLEVPDAEHAQTALSARVLGQWARTHAA